MRRDSYESLGRHLGASGQTVARWVSGGQPPTQEGLLRKLDETLAGLAAWRRDWFDELRAAGGHAGAHAGLVGAVEEDNVQRDELLRGGAAVAGLAAFVSVERAMARVLPSRGVPSVASARATAEGLFSAYATASPADQLDPARAHLSTVLRGLDRVMLPEQRDELRAVGVDVACLCGWLAHLTGCTGDAHAYFALAVKLANGSGAPELLARAVGSSSGLHSPVLGGDPQTALELVDQARPGAGTGPFRAWLSMGAAEDHATVGRAGNRDACLRAMDEAYRQLDSGEGDGFFSTQGFFAGWNEGSWSGWRGWCYALLRDGDRALGELVPFSALFGV